MITEPLVLQNDFVRLEPLEAAHEEALVEAAADGELWNLIYTGVPRAETARAYIREALDECARGNQYPFVVRRLHDQRIVGSTRYYDISSEHQNLAIGYTWYAQSAQRTVVNTACKSLLLEHAFEKLRCICVAFHTDQLNTRSQAAIARLGARKDGVLRNHRIMPNGRIRDTWCFSIAHAEWPGIKQRLSQRLRQS